jgi:hypothetical protein
VVELAEHAVEQVPEGGGVPITVDSSAVIVIFGWSRSGQGGEDPKESNGVEPVVFDTAAGDRWRSCGVRSVWWRWAARVSMPRCRPARRSAVAMRATDCLAPAAGVGARARIAWA